MHRIRLGPPRATNAAPGVTERPHVAMLDFAAPAKESSAELYRGSDFG